MLLPLPDTEELLLLDETRPARFDERVLDPATAELLRLLLVRSELTPLREEALLPELRV